MNRFLYNSGIIPMTVYLFCIPISFPPQFLAAQETSARRKRFHLGIKGNATNGTNSNPRKDKHPKNNTVVHNNTGLGLFLRSQSLLCFVLFCDSGLIYVLT